MPREWLPVPLGTRLFLSTRESVLSTALAALENSYINEAGGHTAFPPLRLIHDFGRPIDLYLENHRGNLIVVDSFGRMYRMARNYSIRDLTEIPVAGGRRCIFAKTETGLVAAAGQQIISLFGEKTAILSTDAPLSTHVVYLDGYLIAIEHGSGRFYHSRPGFYTQWDPLDVFTAEGKPDDLTCALVTQYRELVLGGPESIEQFEPAPSGPRPFYRRWSNGEGVAAPYTLADSDNAAWAVNRKAEFVRFAVQSAQPRSTDIAAVLNRVTDWSDAWAKEFHFRGQKTIILKIPQAENPYGSKGIAFLYDYQHQRWSTLYSFDEDRGLPVVWFASDVHIMRDWGKTIVAGGGKIYEVVQEDDTAQAFPADSSGSDVRARIMARTGHIDDWGESRIDNLRMRLRRGYMPHGTDRRFNSLTLRVNHDEKGFGHPITKSLGEPGDRRPVIEFGGLGAGHTHQFQYETFQPGVEVVSMEVQITPLGM